MATVPIPTVRRDPVTPSPGDSLVGPPTPAPTSDLARRVTRLLLLRTLVVTVVLALSLWLLMTGDEHPRGAVWLQSGLIATTYLTSIVFGLLIRRGYAPRKLTRPMQASDLVITSLLVYVTAGAQSPYTFLYALSIVSAGALSYRRGAVVVTVASLLAMTMISLLAWTDVLDLPMSAQAHPWDQGKLDFVRTLGINYAALIGVGALSFIFGDQLQRGAETLATTRQAVADLYTLHQDIVRSLASGLITISPDGTVLTANSAAGAILRRPATEMISEKIEVLMPGLDAASPIERADLTIKAGAQDLTIGVTVSALRDVRDQIIGRVVNFQDLTELRRLEQANRRSERLVTVGQLAAGIAHEIRNPLASISGSIELLKQAPQASEDDRTLMTIVHREITRLNVLIGDLLDYANPRPRQPVDIDLGILIDETLQVARGDQAFADVEVTSEVTKPLPIHADPAKLRQVLWNLLRNAADAAATGGKHVTVTGRSDAAGAVVTIADDGPGIERDHIARIFDPFFTTKYHGTGLGLATCHAIVAEHSGRIDVESVVGKGTKMVVRLPRT
ncbi:MAG: multi-sensor signal transduction histidine kinase [Myxococcales bacterium]|nr:multi-sensor signal transduction histidine kinase [Myxococcales bacterium]